MKSIKRITYHNQISTKHLYIKFQFTIRALLSITRVRHVLVLTIILINAVSFGQPYSKTWKDINYAGNSMHYHNLDIYLPSIEKQTYPVVISIYGSAWFSNNSKGADMPTIGKVLLEAGFAVVMPNHRSSLDAKFPAQVHDIKAVIRFIRGNAEKYRLDTSFIGITGSSSGGNLAAMAGTSVNVKEKTIGKQTIDVEGKLGNYISESSAVDAVVAWFPPTNMLVMDSCGGTDFIHNDAKSPASLYIGAPIQENKDLCLLASPTSYVDPADPPFLIFHGTNDRVVPYCQSVILHDALLKSGASSELVLVSGGQHGPGVHVEEYLNMMVDFFKKEASKKTAFHKGNYRNLFLEAGYSEVEIENKVNKAYFDLFEGPNRIYFEVGDSMGYVSDLKNRDVRSEGVSYGMMVAVQLNKKDVFDRIWRWSKKYLQHKEGPREGYLAWSFNPETMKRNAENSASDGEFYIITALLFASNRWGNDTGIDYYADARYILDNMWKKDGTGNVFNLINLEHKQITFVPEGKNYNWTDPSYHVPAFYEIWADYANDGHEQFYRDCADTSRVFLHRACHPVTGLNADYTLFSGEPHSTRWMPAAFRYDSWRVPMNIALDYTWYGKDKIWQEEYADKIQAFFRSKGINVFVDQYNLDGTEPEWILQAGGFRKLRHSLGLKSTIATASLVSKDPNALDFVHALWNAKLEPYDDGYFDPYYDGLLYLFSLMHLSGKYQIITPDFKHNSKI